MRRRDFLLAAALAPAVANAQDFEAFKQQQRQGAQGVQDDFEAYRERMRKAFAAYRQSYRDAFDAFRSRAEAAWQDPELTDRRKWVEYSDDLSVQRVVDFGANRIRLKLPPGDDEAERARAELTDLLLEDKATAFKRDPVAQQVEKDVSDLPVPVERDTPGDDLVLGELFEVPRPGKAEAEEKAAEMVARAEKGRERIKAGSGSEPWATVLTVPLPEARVMDKAREYRPRARELAAEWEVGEALILAVAHTESAFNPQARSHVPAYGLMQIVPESAGRDASAELFGEPRLLAPSFLYKAENNLKLGAVYLHLLYHRYLDAVADPESRLYCAIAAYNTGAGNVARVFTDGTSVDAAARAIRGRSGKEVYRALVAGLPYEETREYLPRVAKRMRAYRDL
jgi:membrane-bound lytic murein transglycosylase C